MMPQIWNEWQKLLEHKTIPNVTDDGWIKTASNSFYIYTHIHLSIEGNCLNFIRYFRSFLGSSLESHKNLLKITFKSGCPYIYRFPWLFWHQAQICHRNIYEPEISLATECYVCAIKSFRFKCWCSSWW